jgi:hypothetical protein
VVNASRMVEASPTAGIQLDQIFVDPLVSPSPSTVSAVATASTRSPSYAGASGPKFTSPAHEQRQFWDSQPAALQRGERCQPFHDRNACSGHGLSGSQPSLYVSARTLQFFR